MIDKRKLVLQLAEQLRAAKSSARQEVDSLLQLARDDLPAFGRDSRADVGAVVDLWRRGEDGDEAQTVFLLPAGGNAEIRGAHVDERFAVVTPSSPWGKALVGRRAGERIPPPPGAASDPWTVLEIS